MAHGAAVTVNHAAAFWPSRREKQEREKESEKERETRRVRERVCHEEEREKQREDGSLELLPDRRTTS